MKELDLLQEMNIYILNILDSNIDEKLDIIEIVVRVYNEKIFNFRNGIG